MNDEVFNALPAGTRIGEFRIEAVLGQGGFGVVYRAHDEVLQQTVAIKEYLPLQFAVRQGDMSVRALTSGGDNTFAWGLGRFLDEARMLARFDHPSLVRVSRYFEANGTAYMVMQYVEGEGLGDVLKRRGSFSESEVRGIIEALLDGLALVHGAGAMHRDITPSNILLRNDGSPVLIDFGAARQAVGERTGALTTVITVPYAPLEQYRSDGAAQGPWTDLYALGAVAYEALSGKKVPDAAARIESDPLVGLAESAPERASAELVHAIEAALAVRSAERPQSIAEWRKLLSAPSGNSPSSAPEPEPEQRPSPRQQRPASQSKSAKSTQERVEEARRRAREACAHAAEARREAAGQVDVSNGYGVFSWTNGERYEGHWNDDQANGYGVYVWPGGEGYEGEWRQGEKRGYGVFVWPDGRRYEGEWRNDERNGYGALTLSDGSVRPGYWRNGKLVAHQGARSVLMFAGVPVLLVLVSFGVWYLRQSGFFRTASVPAPVPVSAPDAVSTSGAAAAGTAVQPVDRLMMVTGAGGAHVRRVPSVTPGTILVTLPPDATVHVTGEVAGNDGSEWLVVEGINFDKPAYVSASLLEDASTVIKRRAAVARQKAEAAATQARAASASAVAAQVQAGDAKQKASVALKRATEARTQALEAKASALQAQHDAQAVGHDVANGVGVYVFPAGDANAGDRYEGEERNNQWDGYGVFSYNNGGRYQGEWSQGQTNGYGVFIDPDLGHYEGAWSYGIRDGYGVNHYSKGNLYEGAWSNDNRDGYGVDHYSQGDLYEGAWSKDYRSGYGVYVWPDSERYEGHWSNDNRDGYGIDHYSKGGLYEGAWSKDYRSGYGVYVWPDSGRYEGHWSKGKRDGYGVEIKTDGTVESGFWRNDALIESASGGN